MKSARNYSAPYTSTSFRDYLAEPSLTLTTCWKLVSKTNVVVGATSHTRDLTLAGHSAPAQVNYALASNGATASASSSFGGNLLPARAIDGYRHTNNNWNSPGAGSGWNSGGAVSVGTPEWLQVDFLEPKNISKIDVYTLADSINYNTDPTSSTTATAWGLKDFKVEYWNGASWITLANVDDNDKAWRSFTFDAITTSKIRVFVTDAYNTNARIIELEAWGSSPIVFKSSQGVVPTATDTELGLDSAGLEVDSIFSIDVLTEETVAAGDWDGAYFEVFILNYMNPSMGELVMFAGTIGEVKTYGERFRAEGRPLSAKATQQVGGVYTEKCTVRRLGDARCKIPITIGSVAAGDGGIITTTGTVTTGGSNVQFNDTSRGEITGYYTYGTVTFTSGKLAGRSSEIMQHIGTAPQSGGNVVRWGSDTSWKMSPTPVAGWETTAFDDSAWTSSVSQGALGVSPWLHNVANFPSDSTAQWLWQFFSVQTRDTVGLTTYFRKTFTPNVSSARLVIVADNDYELFVNGVSIGTGNSYTVAQTYNITLTPNVTNVIAVRGHNTAQSAQFPNPAGILVDITFAAFAPPPTGTGALIQLAIPMPRNIEAGTTYTITRGCDREWMTCKNVFANLTNYRGFPFIPGIERAYKVNR